MDKLFLLSDAFRARKLPSFHRSIYRDIRWESQVFTAILGPRGVGKTTVLLQRLNELDLPSRKALYIDLGDIYFNENRLLDTAMAFVDQGGKYLFIDEVHRYGPGTWATEIKTIYDALGDRLRVVFTGSSQTRILLRQADLSRRVIFHHMQGFSFREFLQVSHDISLPILEWGELTDEYEDYLHRHRAPIGQVHHGLFQDYLQYGYYPIHLEDPAPLRLQLNSMVQTVLDMDVPYFLETPNNLNPRQLSRLLQVIATSVPFKPNYTKMGERIGLRRQLVENYFVALERAQLVRLVAADSTGVAALGKPEKIYLDNPNLVYALNPSVPEVGTIRETAFVNFITPLTRRTELVPPHLAVPKAGDFVVTYRERRKVFEVGGPNKESKQIGTAANHFVVVDALRVSGRQRLPLWLFGLLY